MVHRRDPQQCRRNISVFRRRDVFTENPSSRGLVVNRTNRIDDTAVNSKLIHTPNQKVIMMNIYGDDFIETPTRRKRQHAGDYIQQYRDMVETLYTAVLRINFGTKCRPVGWCTVAYVLRCEVQDRDDHCCFIRTSNIILSYQVPGTKQHTK